ncbi:MAG: DUF1120 domain-containing protein [Burkholderiales bacterium]|nr:DUF1120 domain-containing protein [Burkholderiales bacterium]
MFKKAMIASAVLAGAFAAQAQVGTPAPSATLTVGGTVTAPICSLALAGGGAATFGTITRPLTGWTTISTAPARYQAPASKKQTVALNVSCPAPTKMALAMQDNRSASVVAPASAVANFGLGTYTPAGGGTATNIGNFFVDYTGLQITPTVGGTAAAPAVKLVTAGTATSSSTWAAATGVLASYLPTSQSLGFAATAGATTPDSLASIAGNLVVNVELSKATVDAATSDITLDGNATITLVGL